MTPLERLWRELKEWLASYPPTTLDELAALLSTRLRQYTPAALRSLTGFPYLLTALQALIG